jgi:hypothetical protein
VRLTYRRNIQQRKRKAAFTSLWRANISHDTPKKSHLLLGISEWNFFPYNTVYWKNNPRTKNMELLRARHIYSTLIARGKLATKMRSRSSSARTLPYISSMHLAPMKDN